MSAVVLYLPCFEFPDRTELRAGLERCLKALSEASVADQLAARPAANDDCKAKEIGDASSGEAARLQELLDATLAELNIALAELEEEKSKSMSAAVCAQEDAEMLLNTQAEVRQLQSELRGLLSSRESEEAQLEQELEALKGEHAASNTRNHSLVSQVNDMTAQLAALGTQVEQKNALLNALGAQSKALEDEKAVLKNTLDMMREEKATAEEPAAGDESARQSARADWAVREEGLAKLSLGLEKTIAELERVVARRPETVGSLHPHDRQVAPGPGLPLHMPRDSPNGLATPSPKACLQGGLSSSESSQRARGQRLSDELSSSLRSPQGASAVDVAMVMEEVRMLEDALEQCEQALASQLSPSVLSVELAVTIMDGTAACDTQEELPAAREELPCSLGQRLPAGSAAERERRTWPRSPAAQLAREESEYETRQAMHAQAMQACMAQMDSLRAELQAERDKSSMLQASLAASQQQHVAGPEPRVAASSEAQQSYTARIQTWMPPVMPLPAHAAATDARPQQHPPPTSQEEPVTQADFAGRKVNPNAASTASPAPSPVAIAREAKGYDADERTPSPVAFVFVPSPYPAAVGVPGQAATVPIGSSSSSVARADRDAAQRRAEDRGKAEQGRAVDTPQQAPAAAPAAHLAPRATNQECRQAPVPAEPSPESRGGPGSPARPEQPSSSSSSSDRALLHQTTALTPEMAQAIVERVCALSPQAAATLGLDSLMVSAGKKAGGGDAVSYTVGNDRTVTWHVVVSVCISQFLRAGSRGRAPPSLIGIIVSCAINCAMSPREVGISCQRSELDTRMA